MSDFLPYPPSSNNRPSSVRTVGLVSPPIMGQSEAKLPPNARSHPISMPPSQDHLPYLARTLVNKTRTTSETWTSLNANVELANCSDVTCLIGFVQLVDELLDRANEEFLKEVPRQALAEAYRARAGSHGKDLEKAIVDYLVALQLFPADPEIQETHRVMVTLLMHIWRARSSAAHGGLLGEYCDSSWYLKADENSAAWGGKTANGRRESNGLAATNSGV
ncbi:hypothetical protein C8R45DRAFT_936818 [Mycena sanguinolenta]|nr:hypothetical protein C8R45DRAFT_936818 [Mycena sanguinolenta]